jgi:hypothetical protein
MPVNAGQHAADIAFKAALSSEGLFAGLSSAQAFFFQSAF